MIRQPASVIVAGPSGSGKSELVEHLLQENTLFDPPPKKIVYCYDRWQPRFDRMKRHMTFYRGLPPEGAMVKWFKPDDHGILILDDLMEESGGDKRVLDLFTKDSHHRGITAVYITQDLFPPGKFAKTINRNAHYVICFKSPRDKTGIRNLLLQVYPDKWRQVLQLFLKLTSRPFGYVMLDLHPASDDCLRIWSHLTKAEGAPQVHTFDEDINSRSLVASANRTMPRQRVTKRGRGNPGVGRQLGEGIAPLLQALLPALGTLGKAAAEGGVRAGANYGTTKALHAAEKKRYKRKRQKQQRKRQQQQQQYGSYE